MTCGEGLRDRSRGSRRAGLALFQFAVPYGFGRVLGYSQAQQGRVVGMRKLGGLFAVCGLASIGWHFMGKELSILQWIDNWGTNIGWTIRGGLVVIGVLLWKMGKSGQSKG